MGNSRVAALAAAIVAGAACAAGAGEGAGLQGLWVSEALSRSACQLGAGSEGVLGIDRKGFVVTETSRRFGSKAPKGFSAISGAVSCDSEGESLPMRVTMTTHKDRLALSLNGSRASFFRRC